MKRINSEPDGREPDWEGLERLLHDALKGFRAAERPDADVLRRQLDQVTSLDFTGHGFYAQLDLPKDIASLWAPTEYGAVLGYAAGGDERIGLNLFLDRSGRITCLEGFNLGDAPFTGAPAFIVEMRRLIT